MTCLTTVLYYKSPACVPPNLKLSLTSRSSKFQIFFYIAFHLNKYQALRSSIFSNFFLPWVTANLKYFLLFWAPPKELSLCHKLKVSNPYILGTWLCKLFISQTLTIWSNRNHSLKYLRSTALVLIRKSEFVAKTQFL